MSEERKKTVLHHFYDRTTGEVVVEALELLAASEKIFDVNFVALRDVVKGTRELVEATMMPNMGDVIGLNLIGRPDAILWAPDRNSTNWFKRLVEEGYSGKRVLLPASCDAEEGNCDFATHVIQMPSKDFFHRVLRVL
jgi:hypothetical protein